MTATRLSLPYRLGLPAWAFPGWRGRYFPASATPLSSYVEVFNAVEGNTTFYRIPNRKTVAAWRAAVQGLDFQFCFKLPRTLTHERGKPHWDDLKTFLQAMEPLGEHLGPLLVQFPASVGPGDLGTLEALFSKLPSALRYVVEVRHPQFFIEPDLLLPLLNRYRLGRVVLDARALYRGNRAHPEVVAALHEKPHLPVLREVHNELAFLRLVLHPDPKYNARFVDEWVPRVAASIAKGYATYVMIHCPNNLHCPEFALRFHQALMQQPRMNGLAALPHWPIPQQGRLL